MVGRISKIAQSLTPPDGGATRREAGASANNRSETL
jgi:hypothetical protein